MQVEAGKRTKVQLEEVKRRFAAREEAHASLRSSLEAASDTAQRDLQEASQQRSVLGQQVLALESSLQTEQRLVEALHEYLGSLESELELVAGRGEEAAATAAAQVSFCQHRFSPTGELGYSSIRGAVRLGYRSTV
jgi:adenylosuccinate lyase